MEPRTSNDGYALLIGVDDYSAFDASADLPAGTSDLPGSRNNALKLLWVCRELLGLPAENIRVLTSPKLDPSRLGRDVGVALGEATEPSIREGLAWLVEHLAAADAGGAKPPGLFAFSGHGAWIAGKGAALCPADVRGRSLDGAIPIADLRAAVRSGGVAEGLTVILDACHVAAPERAAGSRRRVSSLASGAAKDVDLERELATERFDISDRVILAARPGQQAWQSMLGREAHGALTFAITAIMEQWCSTQEGSSVRLDVAYGDLVTRAGRIYEALLFPGAPELVGPRGLAERPFFDRSLRDDGDRAVARPDRGRSGVQLDGGFRVGGSHVWRRYTLQFVNTKDGTTTALAHATIVSKAAATLVGDDTPYREPDIEYWAVNTAAFTTTLESQRLGDPRWTINVSHEDGGSGAPSGTGSSYNQTFSLAEDAAWEPTSEAATGGYLYRNGNIYLQLAVDANDQVSTIAWYQVIDQGAVGANITPDGAFVYQGSAGVSVGRNQQIVTILQRVA